MTAPSYLDLSNSSPLVAVLGKRKAKDEGLMMENSGSKKDKETEVLGSRKKPLILKMKRR